MDRSMADRSTTAERVPDTATGGWERQPARRDPAGYVRYLADAVVTVDDEERVLSPGAVDVLGERVVWVGDPGDRDLPAGTDVRKVGGVLMPGLVNTHAHSPMTLLRSAGDGLSLQRWLQEVIWPREAHLTADDVYWGMTLGCEELLTTGVTTTCEMYLFDDALVDAAIDAGIRCVATPGIFDLPDRGTEGHWTSFLSRAQELRSKAHGREGRISVGFGPHSAYALPPDALRTIAKVATESDAMVHIHVAENPGEVEQIATRDGCTVPELLEHVGILEAHCLAAHSVWLDDADLDRYRKYGVCVAHCPGSNGKLGSGIARLRDLLEAGVTVGLGTDGPASNDDLDLWEELRLAALLARITSGDASAVTTNQALRLATVSGGRALGLDVGSLQSGRLADFIRLESEDVRLVPGISAHQLVAHLVWAAHGAQVTNVWVGGREVVADGVCRTVDGRRARREGRQRAQRLRESAGQG